MASLKITMAEYFDYICQFTIATRSNLVQKVQTKWLLLCIWFSIGFSFGAYFTQSAAVCKLIFVESYQML